MTSHMQKYLDTLTLPLNSLLLDAAEPHPNGGNPVLIMAPTTDNKFQCPLDWCQEQFETLQKWYCHARVSHLDRTRPLFNVEKSGAAGEYYQPNWLSGSAIYFHRPSNRAICVTTLELLRQSEIIPHLSYCIGCQNWQRSYYVPHDPAVLDTPIDVGTENELPGATLFTMMKEGPHELAKYRLITPFRLTNSDEMSKSRRTCQNPKGKRRKGYDPAHVDVFVGTRSIPQVIRARNPLTNFATFQQQIYLRVKLCLIYMDIATFGCHRAVACRIGGPAHWLDDEKETRPGFWFGEHEANQQLFDLPYPLCDAVDVEAKLSNICTDGIGSVDAQCARLMISSTLASILRSVIKFPNIAGVHQTRYRNRSNGEGRSLRFYNGELFIGVKGNFERLPWVIAELIVRYLLIIRPLEIKYDDEEFTKGSKLVMNVGRLRQQVQMDRRLELVDEVTKFHGLRCGANETFAMGQETRINMDSSEALVRKWHPCLVSYYA